MNEQSNTIKSQSRVGTLVEGLDNPDKAFKTSMKPTKEDFEALEMADSEAEALAREEAEKGVLTGPGSMQDKLTNYNKYMTMEAILNILTHEEAVKSTKKDVIIKAWKKTKRKMENTSTKIEKIVGELMKQIIVVKAKNEPTKEVGLIKT